MTTRNADASTSSATVDSPAGSSTDTGKNDDLDTSVPQDSIDAFEDELSGAIGAGLSFDDEDEEDDDEDDVEYEDDEEEGSDEGGEPANGDAPAAGGDAGAEAKADDRVRNPDGTYREKTAEEKAADAKKPDAAATEAKPAADTKAADTKAADAPKADGWKPLAIKHGGKMAPVNDVQFSEVGEHLLVTVPKAKAGSLIGLMQRGMDHGNVRSQLARAERRIEAMKSAPKRLSDGEIEAKLTLELLKPHLPALLDETQMELLEAKVKNAIFEENARFEKENGDHQSKLDAPSWEEEQTNGIEREMLGIRARFPELKGLSDDDLGAVYLESVRPVAASVYFKGTGDNANKNFVNTQYLYDRLKARAEWRARQGGPAPSSDAPKGGTTTTAGGGTGAAPTASDKRTTEAERFNRGQDAAKPQSTNLKERRGRGRPDKASRRARAAAGRSQEEDRMDAEDALRKTQRAFMNSKSPGFDFDDDES